MKAADLDILLQEGEGTLLEYKESLSSSFARELVGFANTAGGRILLGVRDDGAIKGIADTNDLRARIQDFARNCDPPVKILLQRVGEVTVVTVRESAAKPVQCSDGFFWRQGAGTQKLQREEIPEYPVASLREAITNAVMHRDWFIEGANVFVEIYEDRVEVSSPGGLPKGMLSENLGSKSVRRNPLIADLLHRIAFIEKAGTGIRRMRDGARAKGYPEPAFSTGSFFIAVFRPLPQPTPQDAPHAGRTHEPGQAHDKVHDKVHEPMNAVTYRLLMGCANEPQGTPALLRDLGYETRTGNFRVALSRLLACGYLEMTIPDKPKSKKQRYRATPAGRAVLQTHNQETTA